MVARQIGSATGSSCDTESPGGVTTNVPSRGQGFPDPLMSSADDSTSAVATSPGVRRSTCAALAGRFSTCTSTPPAAVTRFASGYPTSMHWFDDVFLKDTTTRRNVFADSIGPLVTVRSASEQWPGAPAGAPPPPPPSLGGPPACAVAATPSVAAEMAIPAANVANGFMISPISHGIRMPCHYSIRDIAAHVKRHSAHPSTIRKNQACLPKGVAATAVS